MAYFDEDGKAVEKPEPADSGRPAVTTSTDEWLARVSDQLQFLVDTVQSALAKDASDEESDDAPGDDGAGDQGGDTAPGDSTDDPDKGDKPASAKKTTAKRAEVRGQ